MMFPLFLYVFNFSLMRKVEKTHAKGIPQKTRSHIICKNNNLCLVSTSGVTRFTFADYITVIHKCNWGEVKQKRGYPNAKGHPLDQVAAYKD